MVPKVTGAEGRQGYLWQAKQGTTKGPSSHREVLDSQMNKGLQGLRQTRKPNSQGLSREPHTAKIHIFLRDPEIFREGPTNF